MSYFGRYLKVEMPEIDKEFLSNYDRDTDGGNTPRMVLSVNMQRNAYTNGYLDIYNLSSNTIKELEEKDFNLNIYGGYVTQGFGLIVSAKKKYLQVMRIGNDVISRIYFLDFSRVRTTPSTIKNKSFQDAIKSECELSGYKVVFKNNIGSGLFIVNQSLKGTLNDKLSKLCENVGADFFIQANQVIIQSLDYTDNNIVELDSSDGIITIPTFSDVGVRVEFEMLFNPNVKIGDLIKITNKYKRLNFGDNTKTFATDSFETKIKNIKDVVFKVFDIDINLDTRNKDWKMEIEALDPNGV